ncbi:MAG: linear amide C-N hydrolase [Clostridia bacterium]|nr:linear amide C-N hydrolase [Clostridia bacterium]
MNKRLLSLLLSFSMFTLASCGNTGAAPTSDTRNTAATSASTTSASSTALQPTQTSVNITPGAEPFQLLDGSGVRKLYYLDYTEDYKFEEFVSSGGAASTAELVEYAYKAFPQIKLDLSSLGYGCSSFSAQGKDGDVIFGRNFDMDSDNSGSYLIVHTKPENGYESYSTVNLRFLGVGTPEAPKDGTSPLLLAPYIPLDGINSEGLAICVLQLNFPEIHETGSGTDMTSTTIIRNILDNARNVEEAVAIFEKCNVHTDGFAYHYMIGDASGKSAVIESVNNELTVLYKTGNIQVCANTYVTEEGISYYKDPSPADSHNRMNAIVNSVEKSEFELTSENAFLALKAGSNNKTRWSIVYNLTDKTMDFVSNRNFDKIFSFSFKK